MLLILPCVIRSRLFTNITFKTDIRRSCLQSLTKSFNSFGVLILIVNNNKKVWLTTTIIIHSSNGLFKKFHLSDDSCLVRILYSLIRQHSVTNANVANITIYNVFQNNS